MPEGAQAAAAKLYADRVRVYPKDVYGPVRSAKSAILVACLALYYTLPWIRWDRGPGVPDQAVLLDLWHERFYFFSVVLWPQDIYLLTGALILGAVALFLVTSLVGRAWCGYTCPQTVWTDLFLMVERWIEGDRNARMKRDAGPWTRDKIWRKAAKHWVWFWVAFWTGGAWVMYYVNAPVVVVEFWTGRASPDVYAMTLLFTLTTYLLAGWAREQVCLYMCPWPRFQSAMLDEQTLIVTYEAWRGEPRGHGRRDAGEAAGILGDCVDCQACVNVCPTGVDIRAGIQLGCINCGLCMDACNTVMERIGRAPWLITWDNLARQKARAQGKRARLRLIRPRTVLYTMALGMGGALLLYGVVTRSTVTISAIHDRAPLFVRLRDGGLRNGFTIKLANKTQAPAEYRLSAEGLPGEAVAAPDLAQGFGPAVALNVAAGSVGEFRMMVRGTPAASADGRCRFSFVLRNVKTGEMRREGALFIAPPQASPE